jgi:hypothetical protein
VDTLYDLPIDDHVVVIEGGEVFLPFASDCIGACVGCMYEDACNYDQNATEDDGSCDFSCLVSPEFCGLGTIWDVTLSLCIVEEGDEACPHDINGDGLINVFDLLILLAEFSMTCP